MTGVLPEPPVAPEVDLRDFEFMPLDVQRLRDSALAATVTGDEFRAAVLLWCAAWHQVPAASLPDDDALLSQYAGYGRVVREWRKVKDGAMRGFEKCSDGRLYHPVVAEKAVESWGKKNEASRRRAEDRQRKKMSRSSGSPLECPPDIYAALPDLSRGQPGMSDGNPQDFPLKGQGPEGKGDEESPAPKLREPYAFDGSIIRLSSRDFSDWSKNFHAYPDLRAELAAIDAKLVESGHKGEWFAKVSGWLRSGHVRLLEGRMPSRTSEDETAIWRSILRSWVKGGRKPSTWPEGKGIPPGRPGCQAPEHLLREFGLITLSVA